MLTYDWCSGWSQSKSQGGLKLLSVYVSQVLFEKFEALQVKDGVLQRACKEPTTGEEMWQMLDPRALKESVL